MRLCAKHRREYMDWFDYRLPPAPIKLITIGDTERHAVESRKLRARTWAETINNQQALIKELCSKGIGCDS